MRLGAGEAFCLLQLQMVILSGTKFKMSMTDGSADGADQQPISKMCGVWCGITAQKNEWKPAAKVAYGCGVLNKEMYI
jgi:hypothetical protein